MKKAVIFDMDGTLWDSVDEIVESWNKTCPEMHIRREQLIGLMGKTMDCFARELLPEYEMGQAMEIIHACERKSALSATARRDILKYSWSIITWVIWWQTSSVMATRSSRRM